MIIVPINCDTRVQVLHNKQYEWIGGLLLNFSTLNPTVGTERTEADLVEILSLLRIRDIFGTGTDTDADPYEYLWLTNLDADPHP